LRLRKIFEAIPTQREYLISVLLLYSYGTLQSITIHFGKSIATETITDTTELLFISVYKVLKKKKKIIFKTITDYRILNWLVTTFTANAQNTGWSENEKNKKLRNKTRTIDNNITVYDFILYFYLFFRLAIQCLQLNGDVYDTAAGILLVLHGTYSNVWCELIK
jgi:hypothetical protein